MATVRDITSALRSDRTVPAKEEQDLLGYLDRIESEGAHWRNLEDEDKWADFNRLYKGRRYSDLRMNPKFYVPMIRPIVDRFNSMLLENKPGAKILPWREGLGATATALEKLFEAEWQNTDMQLALEEMRQMASIFGSAGIDAAYNPTAQFGHGSFDPVALDPRQVIFDPSVRKARLMDKAMYVRIETVRNIWDLQRDYPGRGMLVKPDTSVSSVPSTIQGSGNSMVIKAAQASFFTRMQELEEGPIPRKRCREYFIRDPRIRANGDPFFPRGRKIERAGEVILDDASNPYWDGTWPTVWYDNRPDIESPWGRSEVEALRFIVDAANKIGNQFVDSTILGGNLVVVTDSDAISNETRNKLTNAGGLIVAKKFGRQVDWRPPPPMPPHMMQFVSQAMGFANFVVGLDDGGLIQGKGRIEQRSGVQLEGLQTAGQVLVRAAARRLEAFLERFGQKWISRVFQFYTGERLYQYLDVGSKEAESLKWSYLDFQKQLVAAYKAMVGGPRPEEWTKTETVQEMMSSAWRDFAFKLQPYSTLSTTKLARAQLLMQMAQVNRYPWQLVMREMGIDDPMEKFKLIAQERAILGPPPEPPKKKSSGGKQQ